MDKRIEIKPGDKLLVCRTDRLGDLILALPFVESLKRSYPECRVDVMASLYASPVLEHNDNIDGIVRVQNDQILSSKAYRKDLHRRVKTAGYNVVVVLYPDRMICRMLHRTAIPVRIGTAGRFHSVFFSHRLMHSRKANKKHEFEYNLDFLAYFKTEKPPVHPKVNLTEKEITNARRIIRKAGIDNSFIVLHPGSGGSADRWNLDSFLKLYQKLDKDGYQLLVTGSESEGELINKAVSGYGFSLRSIAGQTDLRTLAAVLSLASTIVANSTGPLHLAAAVGTRVVGLYPSKHIMSPVRWGPLGEGHLVLQPESKLCSCPESNCRCMESISVDRVASVTREVYSHVT